MNSFNLKNNINTNLSTFKSNLMKEGSYTPKSNLNQPKKNSFLNLDKITLNPTSSILPISSSTKNNQPSNNYSSFKVGQNILHTDEGANKKKEFIEFHALTQDKSILLLMN
jgi:hypothetical protein